MKWAVAVLGVLLLVVAVGYGIGGSTLQLPAYLVNSSGVTIGEIAENGSIVIYAPTTPAPTPTPTTPPPTTPPPTPTNFMRVVVYADIHYGVAEPYLNSTRTIIANLITWKPDVVMVLGDIVVTRTDAQFQLYKSLAFDPVHNAGIPQIFSCGDHDDLPPYSPWYTWPWAIPYTVAKPYGSYDIGPVHFVLACDGFGPWYIDMKHPLSTVQKAWVDADIGASTKPWRVLAVHTGGYADPSKLWMLPLTDPNYVYNRALFDGWLRKYPGLMFWAGGQHQFDDYRLNGTVYLHAPEAVNYHGYPEPHMEGDFAVADFNDTAVRFRVVNWQNATVYDSTFRRG